MKISRGNVEITEIPYFDKIIVQNDGFVLDDGEGVFPMSREDIISLRNALTAALNAHAEMTGVPTGPQVFERGASAPGPEVTQVKDVEGDTWTRSGGYWYLDEAGASDHSWSDVLDFAPLTEVRDDA